MAFVWSTGSIIQYESFLHHAPAGIGIEFGHCGCCLGGGRSQVFLEQHTILVHDECHHALNCRILPDRRRRRTRPPSSRRPRSPSHRPVRDCPAGSAYESNNHGKAGARSALRYILRWLHTPTVARADFSVDHPATSQYKPLCLPGSLMNFTAKLLCASVRVAP